MSARLLNNLSISLELEETMVNKLIKKEESMNPKEDKLSKKSTQNKEMKSTAKNIMASPTKKAPTKAMGTPLKSTTKKMPAAGTNT